jgi:hypothetical protein
MRNIPVPQQIYRHFKGNLYQIVTIAEHTETGEKLVIYQALYGEFKIYARPLSMFLEEVDSQKYPDCGQKYRFEPVEERSNLSETGKEEQTDTRVCTPADNAGTLDIDPLVLDFLDAGTYEEKLEILEGLHHRITDEMITTMAIALDIEVKEGEIEERYTELRKCLLLYDKFECSRLR